MPVADSRLLATASSKPMSGEIGVGSYFPDFLPDTMSRSLQIEGTTTGNARSARRLDGNVQAFWP